MFSRTFHPRQFLRSVYGSEPFAEYCASRCIAFEQILGFPLKDEDYLRWQAAMERLPGEQQARIELELAQVNEVANPTALAQLIAAGGEQTLPDDSIPGEAAPTLWFFLHRAELFREVFLHQEIGEVDAWRIAHAPTGIILKNADHKEETLAESLRDFFRVREGTGRFCAVERYRLGDSSCFAAYLSGRLRLAEVFTERGQRTTRTARPAFPVLFIYDPRDGRVMLKARQRARDKLLDLFQRFGTTVLGIELDERSLAPAFRLDLLKRRFEPLPDAEDMLRVRMKTLHLVYPGRDGRRRLKLETLAGDHPSAIFDLLREHGGRDNILDRLDVLYAELEVMLRVEGGSKPYLIRLWPDRCSINQTPLGERLRSCLKRWGLMYAP